MELVVMEISIVTVLVIFALFLYGLYFVDRKYKKIEAERILKKWKLR